MQSKSETDLTISVAIEIRPASLKMHSYENMAYIKKWLLNERLDEQLHVILKVYPILLCKCSYDISGI